ncbi:hypothetical protein GBA52_017317 [Prunus armeniaca]|nr:hypothetical protein GBA52_017317 [Prunus armeniaca]
MEASCTYLKQLLPLAWSHNPLTTLKLICRKLKCDGKSYEEAFYTAAYWLHHNHPDILLRNIPSIAGSFGRFPELVEVLYRVLEGRDGRRGTKKILDMAKKAAERYKRDPAYQMLHYRVTDVFVDCLKSDLEKLKESDINHNDDQEDCEKITCAATCCFWFSYENCTATLLWESIAVKVFPRESYPEYQDVKEADYVDRVRNRLRKEVLVPLVNYYRLPNTSREMHFSVEKYLEEVKAGKSKTAADALLPNEILSYATHWDLGQAAELQWKATVEDFKKQGKMSRCLAAVWDGYMYPEYKVKTRSREASVALTLLVSELSEEPWKGKLIAVDSDEAHELLSIRGSDLRIDDETDFEALLDLLLQVAVDENLKPEHMIKLVFGVRDDRFDEYRGWQQTKYEAIQREYEEKGYGDAELRCIVSHEYGMQSR